MKTKAEVETVLEKLLHLLRFAMKAVPDPRLCRTSMETKNIVKSADAVENERPMEAFAKLDLRLESCQLEGIGGVAESIEATFTDKGKVRCTGRKTYWRGDVGGSGFHLCEAGGPVLCDFPGVKAEGGEGGFSFRGGTVGMEVKVWEHL